MRPVKFELTTYRKNRRKSVWCIKVRGSPSQGFYNFAVDDFLDPHKNKRFFIGGTTAYRYSNKTLAEEALLCAIIRFC